MVKRILFAVMLYSCYLTPVLAKLIATVDRKTVRIDETLTLTIKTDEPVTHTPDLNQLTSGLQPLSSNRFSRSSNLNGKRVSESGWDIQLIALEEGIITIPSFTIGNESTQAIQITVLAANQSPVDGGIAPLYSEVELSEVNPFVQQQVILTVKISSDSDIDNAQLLPPQLNNVLIRSLGEPTEYVSRRSGKLYRIQEFKFSLFPQQEGLLEIPSLVFRGNKIVRYQSRNPLSLLSSQSRRVRIKTEPIVMDVKAAIPSAHTWLPATQLNITASWKPEPQALSVGDPITRVLTIQAEGLDATQLPEFSMPEIDGISWFPNPPERAISFDGTQINSNSTQRFAMIPNREGLYQLPAVDIHWYDVVNKQFKVARIEAREIQVSAAVIVNHDPLANPLENLTLGAKADSNQETLDVDAINSDPFWKYVSAMLLFGWLLTLFGFIFLRKNQPQSKPLAVETGNVLAVEQKLSPASTWKAVAKQIVGLSSTEAYNLIKIKSESNFDDFDSFVIAIKNLGMLPLAESLKLLSQNAFSETPKNDFNAELTQLLAQLPNEINYPPSNKKQKISPLYD